MGKIKVCGNKMETCCHHVLAAFFQILKEVVVRVSCHSSTASVCGSFARHSPGLLRFVPGFVEGN